MSKTEKTMLHEKLVIIQRNLKAPKDLRNSFGGYNYRSAESILESVKPLLGESGISLTLSDELVNLGDRYYIKATASITDGTDTITTTSYAREEEVKKGMDGSQITGASSSYARKYALNGLFLIDDTKDSDATNTHGKETVTKAKAPAPKTTPAKPAATSKTKSSPKDKLTDGKGGLTPSKEFQDDDSDRRAKAIKAFGKLGDEKVVMAKIIKETGSAKHLHLVDFVNKEPIDKVLEIYTKIKG